MKRVCYILEGQNGTGKTTISHEMQRLIKEYNIFDNTEYIHFPTEYPPESYNNHQKALWMLFDFQQTLDNMWGEYDCLILDRSFISTLVYQGYEDVDHQNTCKTNSIYHSILQFGKHLFTHDDYLTQICHITCSKDTLKKRLGKRNHNKFCEHVHKKGLKYERSIEKIKHFYPHDFDILCVQNDQDCDKKDVAKNIISGK